jgi:hypothetical protein
MNQMTNKIWTRGEIENMINTSDLAVERGIVAIWQRQTQYERDAGSVVKDNGMGFAAWGARSGSYYANWINSGKHLSGKHLVKARKIAFYHAGQLTNIANGLIKEA